MSKLWFFGGIVAVLAVLVVFVGGVAAFNGKDSTTVVSPAVKTCQCGKDSACGGKCGANCGCQAQNNGTGCGCANEQGSTCSGGCGKTTGTGCGCGK